MKVLVTGGCGFLGSHVCEYYIKKGWEVVSYDNMTKYELNKVGYDANLARDYNRNYLKKIGVDLKEKDIRNLDDITKAAERCDYIVHTAAQPTMTLAIDDPFHDLESNILGTFNVLEAARHYSVPVVNCCSIHVYGNGINDKLTEGKTRYYLDPSEIPEDYPIMTGEITPLHASKKSAEYYVQAFIDTYGLKAASFRLTGLYGPRQFGGEDHGWIANFAIRTATDRPITIFNTGKQVRDIIFATDVCEAFQAFFENQVSGIYNIGGGNKCAISLLESIDILTELKGKRPEVRFGGQRLGDLSYFVCDTTRAKTNLKWEAKIPPEDGIRRLYQWIEDNLYIFRS